MQKLADISVFENLQAHANTQMGLEANGASPNCRTNAQCLPITAPIPSSPKSSTVGIAAP